MSNGIFGIGLTGLYAAQQGLTTAGHNIANVNTAGYSRQETMQTASPALFTGSGWLGQGTDVIGVRRVYADHLVSQLRSATADGASLDTLATELTRLDDLFGDPAAGLAPALDEFFSAVEGLAAHPADIPSRQALLGASRALVSRFTVLDGQLSDIRTSTNARISTTVDQINGDVAEIARLNRQIALANGDPSRPPNDLLDRRDAIAQRLASSIGIRTAFQTDGSMNVFLSSGQPLVVGQVSTLLDVRASIESPQDLEIGLSASGFVALKSADLSGGALGGLLAFRDGALVDAQNELGRLAASLAGAVNEQHRLGQDLAGAAGGDLFTLPTPASRALSTNTGSGVLAVNVADPSALMASDYELRRTGSGYTLTRLSDSASWSYATLPQTVDGLTISLASGAAASGDRFRIEAVRGTAGGLALALADPSLLAAATPVIAGPAATNTGSGALNGTSISSAYWATPLAAPFTITYSSGTNSMTGFPSVPVSVTVGSTTTVYPAATPVPWTAGARVSFGGVTFTLAGNPTNGDQFTIGPNVGGVGDNRNIQTLAALADRTLVGGNATFAGAYGAMVSDVGQATHEAVVERDAQTIVTGQLVAAQQGVSGVNLDEEAANLQRYQQAYQASAKVMALAASLFDTVLDIARG